MSLPDALSDPQKRQNVIRDATDVLNAEVRDKGGVSGIAVKATFKMVRGISPDFIPTTIDALLDDFAGKVQPFYEAWEAGGRAGSCASYFQSRGGEVADALLSITDERARKSDHRTLVKAYQKLRPKGHAHVVASMPRVGALIEKYGS
ncbi:MAG TPA: hypothetical protein DIU15_10785 [Deltaproteobacteria bacterium]|nr:hypothetical protein [Deltaproteobacteria bacterium]HCP46522.1 hypothetical protein [Deltaproteobacteria bacterium]